MSTQSLVWNVQSMWYQIGLNMAWVGYSFKTR